MAPPPVKVFTHVLLADSSESWATDIMSRSWVCMEREDPFLEVEVLRIAASYGPLVLDRDSRNCVSSDPPL
ncbi:hypothetical protein MN0502_31990 [Arthrobacter sp. MN05-02]|nr:hypothetical protein MN0502_31990 [Arthrobacter sp. MN05-02]